MSSKVQPVRGTQDLLPEQCALFRGIDHKALAIAQLYGYSEISTPIFEFSEVFHRSLGDSSDMVSKETYDFKDRGGDSLTLRPEGTAGVVRAFISNGLAQNLPLKFYYSGPMFRYERPQKGRYRQFHQMGVECLGHESPFIDAESIAMGDQILREIGLTNKYQLEINTLGDSESRAKHRGLLVEYLTKYESDLSADSKIRLQKNPLRILDSKDEGDKKIVAGAPSLQNCLNDSSKKFFDQVLKGLTLSNVNFHLNDKLVRGIDYYVHTVFEFTTDHLGSQGTLMAGGRYDGLVQQLGGPATPGFGWGAGIERMSLMVDPEQFTDNKKVLAVLAAEDSAEDYCMKLTQALRSKGQVCELILGGGNFGKKMKRANKMNAAYALIAGGNEIAANNVTVKNLANGEQKTMSWEDCYRL